MPNRLPNLSDRYTLKLHPEVKAELLALVSSALESGSDVDAGIAVCFHIRERLGRDAAVALVCREPPEEARSKVEALAKVKTVVCGWIPIAQIVDGIELPEESQRKLSAPPPPGQFRLALFAKDVTFTMMRLPAAQ